MRSENTTPAGKIKHKHGWPLRAFRLLAAGLLLLSSVAALAEHHGKIAADFGQFPVHRDGTVDVIIQFNQTPTDVQHQKVQNKGGVLKTKLDFIKGAHYSVPVGSVEALADDPDVAYISPDRRLNGLLDNTARAVNANVAWQSGWDGTGITVAVIDSGITTNISSSADLYSSGGGGGKLRILYSQDFVGGGTDDHYGHGQHVAGVIAGSGKNSSYSWTDTRTFKGIAPNASLVNLRVLDQNGQGTDSGVIAAIQQAIYLQSKYKIRVINLSLGRQVYESYKLDPLCQAVEAAWKKGIVVVAAAGNYGRDNSMGTSGYATITAPGNDPYVITVGAMKTEGSPDRSNSLITSYSSKGPTLIDHVVKPDIVAPGNRVVSLFASYIDPTTGLNTAATLPQQYSQNLVQYCYYQQYTCGSSSNLYYSLSGTSMATPVVSGGVALLLQAQPRLTPDQVKARLMKTAYKKFPSYSTATDPITGATYTSQYDIFTVGAGLLDIGAAIASSDLATGSALSPTAVYDSTQNAVYLVTDAGSTWGTSIVWGSSIVWGTNVFVNGTSIVWGDSVCWGTSTDTGFSVVWGTSIVWGTSNQLSSETSSVILGEN
jgi:serine protease AprX